MKEVLDIQEYFVEGGDQERSHVLLHITEPSTQEELKKGYFFAVSELNGAGVEQIEELQRLIDELETTYYQAQDEDYKNAFETSLENINKRGHHILRDGYTAINCVVGVIAQEHISFSYRGTPDIMLIFAGKNGPEHILLTEHKEQPADQLFPAILEGDMRPGDNFYVATPHGSDYITRDRLTTVIMSRLPKDSVDHIEKVLNDTKTGVSFGGILFHATEEPAKSDVKKKEALVAHTDPEKKEEEIEEKFEEEEEKLPNETEPKVETNYRPLEEEKESLLNTVLIIIGKTIVIGVKSVINFVKNTILFIGRAFIGLIVIITNKAGQRNTVLENIKKSLTKKKKFVDDMPLIGKMLLLLVVALSLTFAGSLLYLRFNKLKKVQEEDYTNLIQTITDKKNAADASLLYGDNARALALLQEASTLAETLPQNNPTKKELQEKITADLEKTRLEVQNFKTVNPELIADLSTSLGGATTTKLVMLDTTLIAYGPDDARMYKIDPVTKKFEIKGHDTIPNLIAANTPKEQDTIIFLTKNNSLAGYDKKTGALLSRDITLPKADVKFNDISIYSQKLYALDPINKQIYKHNRTQTGYDKGTPWLKADTPEIADARGFAIDGDVFVATGNNILKLTSGKKVDFAIQGLDPILTSPDVIWTYYGVNNIYILEGVNKRLVVLDKNGKLIQQYTAKEWAAPTGLVVNEGKKTAFVLDNNKVYKIGL